MTTIRNGILAFLAIAVTVPGLAQEPATWQVIQTQILDQNCVTCHQEGTAFARQSGLILTSDQAYRNLVDVVPQNQAAAGAGLVRVSSEGRQTAPHRSFLWEKIDVTQQSHFYNDHPNYGSMMPLGLPSLTNGQLALIRQWIENGAPEHEAVADVSLLEDTTRFQPPEFQALRPPARGLQLHLGPFDVWASEKWDREFLYFKPYDTQEDMFVQRYEISMPPGSHHFILYNYPDGKPTPTPNTFRDIRNSSGVNNLQNLLELSDLFPFYFFIGTQIPYTNYYFPPGVALRLPPNSGFDMNSHSVNRGGEVQQGEIYVNLHTVDASEVTHAADYDNFGNTDISLPPHQVTTLAKTFRFSETRHIIQMWSHSHEHTVEFRIEGVGGQYDGQLLYWTNDWQHPPFLQLDPPLTMHAGEGFKLITTYDNQTDETIHFGPLSSDEMQFVFYIYYTGTVSSADRPAAVPEQYALYQNFPNPFNPETTIRYSLPAQVPVRLVIYDLLGKKVTTLVDAWQSAGEKSIAWDGRNRSGWPVTSGIYFYKLEAGGTALVRKLTVLR